MNKYRKRHIWFMEIRRLGEENAKEVVQLMRNTFSEYVAPSFTKSGRVSFLRDITEEMIVRKLSDYEGYVAVIDSKVAGVVIAFPRKSKITALFVGKRFQRRGIATALLNHVEIRFRKVGSKSISVRSSVYAVEFYEKMCFRKTRGLVRSKKGWTYQPMKKVLA